MNFGSFLFSFFILSGNMPFVYVIGCLLAVVVGLCLCIRYLQLQLHVPNEKVVNAIAEQLFDVWPVSIIAVDPKDHIWKVNKPLLDELQLDKEAVMGKNIKDVLEIIQDREIILPRVLEELHDGNQRVIPLSSNCFIRDPKNNIRFLIQGAFVGIYIGKHLTTMLLYFRNVLEERTQKHVLNIALSRTQIYQWSFDMERNIMIIDPRYFEHLGLWSKDYTLTVEEYFNLMHPDDRQGVREALTLQLQGNLYENPVEYRLRRSDGTWEWFEAQSTYVGQLSDLPFRIVGICMSTQKYKDTESKLNEALQKAKRSDELKSVFLANMSHEIRTPLNAIVGFSTLLACGDSEFSPQEVAEFTSLIEKNSKLLMVLITDILDLSKIESNTMEFKFKETSLSTTLYEIGKAQEINMREEVKMILELPEKDTAIYTDPTRLGQVINNLINNAVKFTRKGFISLGYMQTSGDEVEIYVRDTGEGMSEEILVHIFERFYKGNTFVQGTGLGLAICRTIIERFHGKIDVTSKEGKGTCFTITLPLQLVL